MSLFDSASLVVTPNGYKEDKLYSIKPTDGSGDLVVTRATTATRVNSAGLVELVPYNLLQYSEDFTNAYWTKNDCSITSNTVAAPNGTLTADKLVENSAAAVHYLNISAGTVSAGTNTISVYAKADGRNWIWLYLFDGVLGSLVGYFNIQNGTLGTIASGLTASIDSVGNGWYRCSITRTQANAGNGGFGLANADSGISYTGNGTSGAYIWGAQLVTGTSAKEYFPTTDRLNVPRLDYTNSSCPSVLVEPQRTNNFTYSEQFDNAYWAKTAATVTANNTASPDGNNTADKVEFNSGFINGTAIVADNQTYTISFFAKKGTANIFIIQEAFYFGTNVVFDLNTGTITSGTGKIENYGNGWYRCSMQITYGVGQHVSSWVLRNYQSGYIYLWGAQLELGSYATSYIPTIASSVTRNADVISKSGISSLIGQTEGTIFVEEVYDANVANNGGVDDTLVSLSDGTTNNLISIFHYGAGGGVDRKVLFFIRLSNVTQAAYYSSSLPSGTYKIAMAYKNNDVAFYINGVQLSTDTSASIPATSALTLVDPVTVLAATKTVNFKSIALFKTRLSNTELATLTTI